MMSLESHVSQDDSHDWATIAEASNSLAGHGMKTADLHRLCNDGTVPYRVDHSGAWLLHVPSLIEYLRCVTGLDHKPIVVRAVEYAALLGHLSRIESKIDTIIESEKFMTEADTQIEADVTALRSAFDSLGTLISTLNTTVSTLQGEVASGGAPSASTLSDLSDITSQISGLVPTVSAPTDPVDTTPVSDPTTPVDTGIPDPTPPATDPGVPDTSETVPSDDPSTVDATADGSGSVGTTDPVVGEAAPSDATPQVVDAPQHQSP